MNSLWKLGGASGTVYPSEASVIIDDFGSQASYSLQISENQLTASNGTPTLDDTWRLYSVSASAGEWSAMLDGARLVTYRHNAPSFAATPELGAAGASHFSGDIAELLLFDHALHPSEREAVGAYLVQKYNLFPPPSPPSVFEAVALDPGRIGLRWSESLPGVIYALERQIALPSLLPGETYSQWQAIGEVKGDDGNAFVDSGLLPATTYHYRLTPRNLAGAGDPIEAAGSTLNDGETALNPGAGGSLGSWHSPADPDKTPLLPAPQNLRIREQFDYQDNIPIHTFDWDAVIPDESSGRQLTGYRVYMNDRLMGDIAATETTHDIDPTPLSQGIYKVFVVAVDGFGRESKPGNVVSFEVDPLIEADAVRDNQSFYAKIEVKRIINQHFPVTNLPSPSTHLPYRAHSFFNSTTPLWDREYNNYPVSFGESYDNPTTWFYSPKVAELLQDTPGRRIDGQGAYRFRVDNHDKRARRVRFRWVEMFCPFPQGAVDTQQRIPEGSQIIGEPREVTIALEAGATVGYSEEYRVSPPEDECGQIRVYLFNPALGIDGGKAALAGGSGQPIEGDLDQDARENHIYTGTQKINIPLSPWGGGLDPETGAPKGALHRIYIGPGMQSNQVESGLYGNQLPIESIKLHALDSDDADISSKLRFYVQEIATGAWQELPFGTELRNPYFLNKRTGADYRFYLEGVQTCDNIRLRLAITIAGYGTTKDIYVSVYPLVRLLVDADWDGVIDLPPDDPEETYADEVTEEKPFRFWINDDNDGYELHADNSPAQSPHSGASLDFTKGADYQTIAGRGRVDGKDDLIDFFPVFLDISSALQQFPPEDGYEYRLTQQDSAVNVVYTDLTRTEARGYHFRDSDVIHGYGSDFASIAELADTRQVTAGGLVLPDAFLAFARQGGGGVILVEGARATKEPLRLLVQRQDVQHKTIVCEAELPLDIDDIETMFWHKNLYPAAGAPASTPDRPDAPGKIGAANPSKKVLHLHGYNVNEQEARGTAADLFKRLLWAGSRAEFHAISWNGAQSQLGGFTPNFHVNVENAFRTAPAFAAYVNQLVADTPPCEITTIAHSLGNMLVLASLNPRAGLDGRDAAFAPARIVRHFALNAAVAAEALDGVTPQRLEMVHSEWENIRSDLWASEWHQLFIPEIGQSRLTWRDRLASANDAVIYNFYSSGEEVLDYRRLDERVDENGQPVPTKSFVLAVWELLDWNQFKFNRVGNRAWYHQELLKGRAAADASLDAGISLGLQASYTRRSMRAFTTPDGKTSGREFSGAGLAMSLASMRIPGWLGSRYGGWGAGPAYVGEESIGLPLIGASLPVPLLPPLNVSISLGLGLSWRGPLDAAQINALDWYEGRRELEPVFLFGNDEPLAGTAANGSRVSDLLDTGGGQFALDNHSKLLAEMIPARTVAMGREAIEKLNQPGITRNYDLSADAFHVGWPTERLSDDDTVFPNKTPRWLHGDVQTIPYLYNHPLFKKWVELGNLE